LNLIRDVHKVYDVHDENQVKNKIQSYEYNHVVRYFSISHQV